MRYKEKRTAPLTMCLVGAPGHAESVYLPNEIETDITKKIKTYKLPLNLTSNKPEN